MKFTVLIISLFIVTTAFSQTGEVVTNQTIIQLQKAGLSKEVLVSKIKSSPCTFDLSTDGLIALKKANIPDEVISAMLTKNSVPLTNNDVAGSKSLSPGIYYYDSARIEYIEFDPSILTNQKSGGFGESLKRSISGIFNAKNRASLSGAEANTVFHTTTPVFTFVFDTTSNGFGNGNALWSSVQSPNELFLVKLKVVKNSREVVVGKENNVSQDIGVDDALKVKCISRKLKKGIYEVTPENNLETGEYCFMFAASSMYAGTTHKVYDFSVK